MSEAVRPFSVKIDQEVLDDLRQRLERTRPAPPAPGERWQYGTDSAYLAELCDHWRTRFDWRDVEERLNTHPQVITTIDGQDVHALHARSPHADATPLLLVHGWPGSVLEFLDVIPLLVDPPDPADAFHVVAPSLPGYGFSGPTSDVGWNPGRIATAFAELMTRLGYERFGTQGGDWGSMITATLAHQSPDRVIGLHLNMVIAGRPAGTEPTEEELAQLAETSWFLEEGSGYQAIQGTKPQTLAHALHDSPAGLAGWIIEKFRDWSDCDGDVERRFTKDQLLANITLYWVTGTIGSSMRLYYEARHGGRYVPSGRIEVPTGCAIFPKELIRPPRRWVEAAYHLVHWTEMPSGGHFAALEEPERLAADVRAFFRSL